MRIKDNFNKDLSGQRAGVALRKQAQKEMKEKGYLDLDFSGIESMNYTFANEVFGKLLIILGTNEFQNNIYIKNANTKILQTIRQVLDKKIEHLEKK